MKLTRGDKLPNAAVREVLAAFIYRWTSDNPQRGAVYGRCPVCKVPGGEPEPTLTRADRMGCRQHHPVIALVSDAEWLRAHAFWITKAGRLHRGRRHAESAALAE